MLDPHLQKDGEWGKKRRTVLPSVCDRLKRIPSSWSHTHTHTQPHFIYQLPSGLTHAHTSQPTSRWWREVWVALGSVQQTRWSRDWHTTPPDHTHTHTSFGSINISYIHRVYIFMSEFPFVYNMFLCLSYRMRQVEEGWFPELSVLLSGSHLLRPLTVHQQPSGWGGGWRW